MFVILFFMCLSLAFGAYVGSALSHNWKKRIKITLLSVLIGAKLHEYNNKRITDLEIRLQSLDEKTPIDQIEDAKLIAVLASQLEAMTYGK